MNLKSRIKKLEELSRKNAPKLKEKKITVFVFINYVENDAEYLYALDNLGHTTLYKSVEELSEKEKIPLNKINIYDRGGIYLPPEAKGIAINGIRI